MLSAILPAEIFAVLLVFCRIGAVFVLMPTIGEAFISMRARLLFAAAFTLVVAPIADPFIPAAPPSALGVGLLVGAELLVGLFIGTVIRMLFASLAAAGTIISFLTGFAYATLFNPTLQDTGSLHSVFLSMLGTVLLFVLELHHVMLTAIVNSYTLFTPGVVPDPGDSAFMIARTVADSFTIALQFAAPFLVINLVFYILLGLLARLMPQLQVFFVALPLQLTLGVLALMIAVPAIMAAFLTYFSDGIGGFIVFNG